MICSTQYILSSAGCECWGRASNVFEVLEKVFEHSRRISASKAQR